MIDELLKHLPVTACPSEPCFLASIKSATGSTILSVNDHLVANPDALARDLAAALNSLCWVAVGEQLPKAGLTVDCLEPVVLSESYDSEKITYYRWRQFSGWITKGGLWGPSNGASRDVKLWRYQTLPPSPEPLVTPLPSLPVGDPQ